MGINPHTVNRWVSHGMPLVILGALGFASYAFCALICVDYLLIDRKFEGTAVALFVVYAFLLALLLASYIRVVWTIKSDPGLVPCGIGGGPTEKERLEVDLNRNVDHNGKKREKQRPDGERLRAVPYASTVSRSSRMESRTPSPLPLEPSPQLEHPPKTLINNNPSSANQQSTQNGLLEMPPPVGPQQHTSEYSISRPQSLAQWMLPKNLHEFYNLDAFICENDGLPRWCFHCNCWKPDRSHHCGELGRCVRKMDHFCPWVGGVVGETSFKFFYQTVCYGLVYCCYLLVVTAVMIQDRGTRGISVPSTWLILLVLACFFLLFCAGMTSTTTQFILRNTTTIDNLSAATKVYQIAIYDPYAPPVNSRDSTYTSTTTEHGNPNLDWQASQLPQLNVAIKRLTRTFVVAKTEPGENPWRLEKRIDNFKEVMGKRVLDWFLPISNSPCTIRNAGQDREAMASFREGMYRFNPVLIERLRRECGIGMRNEEPY
ncbi:DHHC palmitoyltransferase-domain-containing protein [Tirmania nivea]|nr:DHHC palmitoyltransferase-domain-containing protein [Tirmania nivea]